MIPRARCQFVVALNDLNGERTARGLAKSSLEDAKATKVMQHVPVSADALTVDAIWEILRTEAKRDKKRVTEVFVSLDKDGSGSLDAAEFRLALEQVGIVGASDAVIASVMKTADKNADGVVEYQEVSFDPRF